MQFRSRQVGNDEKGFSLVELLVVVVIMGILAAIVVFAVGGITNKGGDSAQAVDRRAIEVAEEAFYARSEISPVYASETDLVNINLLRSVSTTHDICLSEAIPGPPVVPAAKQFEIIDATAGVCSAGFTLAP